jgi:hypothetical protein
MQFSPASILKNGEQAGVTARSGVLAGNRADRVAACHVAASRASRPALGPASGRSVSRGRVAAEARVVGRVRRLPLLAEVRADLSNRWSRGGEIRLSATFPTWPAAAERGAELAGDIRRAGADLCKMSQDGERCGRRMGVADKTGDRLRFDHLDGFANRLGSVLSGDMCSRMCENMRDCSGFSLRRMDGGVMLSPVMLPGFMLPGFMLPGFMPVGFGLGLVLREFRDTWAVRM